MKRFVLASVIASSVFVGTGGIASAGPQPTCSDLLGIAVHGQHIVGDYVSGIGHATMTWPPSGGLIGRTVGANRGVAVSGGPGPGFHFPNGFAPGASFCTDSASPGLHP